MAPFDPESKEAITWLIPSVSLVFTFIAPLLDDVRFYILVLFLIFYVGYTVKFNETKKITIKLKYRSLTCVGIIYAWFIYSHLFMNKNLAVADNSAQGIVLSIIHVGLAIVSSVFDSNLVHNLCLLVTIFLVSFTVFNVTYEYIIEHLFTQVLFFILCWYLEMVVDALFTIKRNISIAYLIVACLPIIRSDFYIMGCYICLFLCVRSYELVYRHYPNQKLAEVTSVVKPQFVDVETGTKEKEEKEPKEKEKEEPEEKEEEEKPLIIKKKKKKKPKPKPKAPTSYFGRPMPPNREDYISTVKKKQSKQSATQRVRGTKEPLPKRLPTINF